MTLPELLERAVEDEPDAPFMLYRDRQISYREFSDEVSSAASGLARAGLGRGDRIALVLPNRPELVVLWFAAASLGAIEVPVNPSLKAPELGHILADAGARWAWIESSNAQELDAIRSELPALTRVVRLPAAGDRASELGAAFSAEGTSDARPTLSVEPDDPAAIIYTSGTTGRPKGVVLSHRSAVATGECTAYMLGLERSDRIATPNPLFHVNAQFHGILAAVAAGASVALLDKFSRSTIVERLHEVEATVLLLSAAACAMMFSREPKGIDGSTGVHTLLTGGLPPDVFAAFERRFRLRVQTAYAMTEAPVALMAPQETSERRPSPGLGRPTTHPDPDFDNRVRIVDDRGEPAPIGEIGEIRVRNSAVMSGYWNDPDATRARCRDGWILTGDLGYRDSSGYYYFVGRKKDLIRRRGELISPAEIESVLSSHPAIAECAVVGAPSGLGIGEEEVVAHVVVSRSTLSAEALILWCEPRLAAFKIPRRVVFHDALPRTALGKIRKRALRG